MSTKYSNNYPISQVSIFCCIRPGIGIFSWWLNHRKLIVLLLIFGAPTMAMGEVSTRVCLADSNTPLELADPNVPFVYRDIMVGTKLTIIVDSNVGGESPIGGEWGSDLTIEGEFRDYGLLSARDYNDATGDWEGSRFEAAGYGARVWEWWELAEPGIQGFNLEGHISAVAGDWFIIEYTATNVGVCKVGFYDRNVSWDYPVYYHVFSHVWTRDFNKDTKVDFADLALLASYWKVTGCSDPNWCEGTDLDTDGDVDFDDLILFADYWLERTE